MLATTVTCFLEVLSYMRSIQSITDAIQKVIYNTACSVALSLKIIFLGTHMYLHRYRNVKIRWKVCFPQEISMKALDKYIHFRAYYG